MLCLVGDGSLAESMSELKTLDPIVKWLEGAGFPQTELEAREALLIIKLPPSGRSRLLADSNLRKSLVSRAKSLGFSRIALELLV